MSIKNSKPNYTTTMPCPACERTISINARRCPGCDETHFYKFNVTKQVRVENCYKCKGSGKVRDEYCSRCSGLPRTLEVMIERIDPKDDSVREIWVDAYDVDLDALTWIRIEEQFPNFSREAVPESASKTSMTNDGCLVMFLFFGASIVAVLAAVT